VNSLGKAKEAVKDGIIRLLMTLAGNGELPLQNLTFLACLILSFFLICFSCYCGKIEEDYRAAVGGTTSHQHFHSSSRELFQFHFVFGEER
jgi:hypothetical protein